MIHDVQPVVIEPSSSRIRWFRFRIRDVFILITILAGFFGWVAYEQHRLAIERQSADRLKEIGTLFGSAGVYDVGRWSHVTTAWGVYSDEQSWWRDLARHLIGRRIYRAIYFHNQENLRLVADLKNLEMLTLVEASVRDLSPLTGLHRLKMLHLKGTQVSNEQIEALQQALPHCRIEQQLSQK